MNCRAIVFDLFGTLVENFSFSEHQGVLAEMARVLTAPAGDFIRLWLATFDERVTGLFPDAAANIEHICRRLHLPVTPERVSVAADLRLAYSRRTLRPLPGAVEILSFLRVRGYQTALISDCSGEVPLLWADTPLAPLVDVPIFSRVVGLKKPDPRIYGLACDRLSVKTSDCIYIGDGGSRELTGAVAVGMHAVQIRYSAGANHDPHRLDPDDWHGSSISTLKEISILLV
jgi:putative hydrolase of the HAD superfamily